MEEDEPEEMSAAGSAAKKKSKSRTCRVTVCLSKDEKARLDNQKGRLSNSEFLRDRWLKPAHPHDPTYEAIGSVYRAALDLKESIGQLEVTRRNLHELFVLLCNTSMGEERSDLLMKVDALIQRLEQRAGGIIRHSDILAGLAREMSDHHLDEVLKHRALPKTKPRRRR